MTTGSDLAVCARDLRKTYRVPVRRNGFLSSVRQLFSQDVQVITALDGVTFEIPRGQVVGYIGPNGAGKSTTVKILTGILRPTSGQALVNGLSPQRDRMKLARQIGVVFGQRTQLWWDLPVRDSFELLAAMYDVDQRSYRKFLEHFGDLLELREFLDTPVRKLSLGQRMRADIAASLIHRPSVLFLDEPTIGLDVVAKTRMRQFLLRLNREQGITVLLTTHDLKDIEELCQRVILINHGRVVFDGSLLSLKEQASLPSTLKVTYSVVPEECTPGVCINQEGKISSGGSAGWPVISVDRASGTVEVQFNRRVSKASVVLAAMQSLGEVVDVSISEPAVEEVIKGMLESRAM